MQEMVRGGIEMILGFHRDPQWAGDPARHGRRHRGAVPGHDAADAAAHGGCAAPRRWSMVQELKTGAPLGGFRGRPRADVPALVYALLAFPDGGPAGERLLEAEINPLFVLPAGQGVRAADGVVVLGR